MATLAGVVNPGKFKARKKDPERMLSDFDKYIKTMKHYLVVTDNAAASKEKKKALLQAIGGADLEYLYEHVGKVVDGDEYDAANNKVREAIKRQCNHAMMKYKLFTEMSQGDEPFAAWWALIKKQSDFTGYDSTKAARDAILFQT